MAESKKSASSHDEQTNQTAESIRNLIQRHKLRSGATQADIDRFNKDLEQIASSLEEQGKSEKEVDELRKERGVETVEEEQMTDAEKVLKTLEESKAQDKAAATDKKNDPMANRLGMPAIPAQPTTDKRDAVEKTAKKAEDDIKKVTESKK